MQPLHFRFERDPNSHLVRWPIQGLNVYHSGRVLSYHQKEKFNLINLDRQGWRWSEGQTRLERLAGPVTSRLESYTWTGRTLGLWRGSKRTGVKVPPWFPHATLYLMKTTDPFPKWKQVCYACHVFNMVLLPFGCHLGILWMVCFFVFGFGFVLFLS